MKKATLTRINEIKALLPIVKELDCYPATYAGGTMESYVIIEDIVINNQFVTIIGEQSMYNFISGKERFNVNKLDAYASNGLADLNYNLSIILKAFKKAIKNNDLIINY